MRRAGALCTCGSPDVRFRGRSPLSFDRRPVFGCGSCGSEWTAGAKGLPYSKFATVEEWYEPRRLALVSPERRRDLMGRTKA